jgi:formate dehydrogenase subunit gamma
MRRLRTVLQFFVVIILVIHAPSPHNAMATDRAATGGAQTLDEIMARQKGAAADNTARRTAIGNPENAAAMTAPLGTLGGASDPDLCVPCVLAPPMSTPHMMDQGQKS